MLKLMTAATLLIAMIAPALAADKTCQGKLRVGEDGMSIGACFVPLDTPMETNAILNACHYSQLCIVRAKVGTVDGVTNVIVHVYSVKELRK